MPTYPQIMSAFENITNVNGNLYTYIVLDVATDRNCVEYMNKRTVGDQEMCSHIL